MHACIHRLTGSYNLSPRIKKNDNASKWKQCKQHIPLLATYMLCMVVTISFALTDYTDSYICIAICVSFNFCRLLKFSVEQISFSRSVACDMPKYT